MACLTLTAGRELPCKGGVSGMRSIGITEFLAPLAEDKGLIKTIPTGIKKIYKYQLKHSGNVYSEEIATDDDARSTAFNGTLSISLQKLDTATRNEILELTKGEVHVFIEMNNGDILLIGNQFGANLSGGTITTGGNKTDFNGYNLTFTTAEDKPLAFLDATAKTAYIALASYK